MDVELDKSSTHKNPFAPSRQKRLLIIGAVVVILLIAGGIIGALAANYMAQSTINIPADIKQKAKSTIYVPKQLPGTFKIVEKSFTFDEDVMIFHATDQVNSKLVFTEQPKPTDFNFEDFYSKEINEPKTLSDVPFASTWGRTPDGKRFVLSVIADDTWLLMNTTAPLGEGDMVRIAMGITRL